MLINEDKQYRLGDIAFAEFVFDENHRLLRLAAAIHWDNLLGQPGRFHSANHGRLPFHYGLRQEP